jgi:hypothetical protein
MLEEEMPRKPLVAGTWIHIAAIIKKFQLSLGTCLAIHHDRSLYRGIPGEVKPTLSMPESRTCTVLITHHLKSRMKAAFYRACLHAIGPPALF